MRGGWVGVDGFFVLSGFLIGSLLVDEQRRTGTIAYLRFLTWIFLRLWPALSAALAAIPVVPPAGGSTRRRGATPPPPTLATVGFYLNWTLTHGGGGQPVEWFGHLWSLGPEFQFYVVTPFVLLALHPVRLRAPRWTWVVLFGALAVGSAGWRREVWLHGSGYPAAYVDTHLLIFDSFLPRRRRRPADHVAVARSALALATAPGRRRRRRVPRLGDHDPELPGPRAVHEGRSVPVRRRLRRHHPVGGRRVPWPGGPGAVDHPAGGRRTPLLQHLPLALPGGAAGGRPAAGLGFRPRSWPCRSP